MPKHLSQPVVLCLSLLLLAGCAEKWAKPGATDQDFQVVKADCSNKASERFPPRLRMVEVTSAISPQMNTVCTGAGPALTCHPQSTQYIPPSTKMVDDNEEARDKDVRACLITNGWQPAS